MNIKHIIILTNGETETKAYNTAPGIPRGICEKH